MFLISLRVELDRFFAVEQVGQNHFRADVPGFEGFQLVVRFNARGDCHKAVQAAGVVTSVFVL